MQIESIILAYYLAISLGFIAHLLSGYYLVGLEIYRGSMLLYGPLYLLWWSAAIFNTNALIIFAEILPFQEYFYSWILTIVLTFINVVIYYPHYYLGNISSLA